MTKLNTLFTITLNTKYMISVLILKRLKGQLGLKWSSLKDPSTWLKQNVFVFSFFVSLLFPDHKSTLVLKLSTAKMPNSGKNNLVCFIQLSSRLSKRPVAHENVT